jgi:YidC/Oxa1 family membrane protein insertase
MSNEKRMILFLVLTFASIMGTQYLLEATGLIPPPPKPQPKPAVQAKADPEAKKPDIVVEVKPKPEAKKVEPVEPKEKGKDGKPTVEPAQESELVLGSVDDKSANGYRLEVQLAQLGAGVESVHSSRYEAEYIEGQKKHRPLALIRRDPLAPASLTMTLSGLNGNQPPLPDGVSAALAAKAEFALDLLLWDVVRDDKGRAARPIPADAKTPAEETGREVVFQTRIGTPEVVITKTYRLKKAADAFTVALKFESPEQDRSVVYHLLGPHGIPIEGEWYTYTFRDVFFGQIDRGRLNIVTKTASDVVKKKDEPEKFEAVPLKFAGVENQYFADFLEPDPTPATPDERWDAETVARIIHENSAAPQKADIAVEITSKPIKIGPNVSVEHTYNVYTGPKLTEVLAPYGAQDLAAYRKYQMVSIPFASQLAKGVIAPLLDHIYDVTRRVARAFGGKNGNYGIAIIMLTLLVRMMMFPLSRKQAIAAKRMQDLQPLLKEIQEKYKEDKERQTKETFALYKKHGVNPVGGCLPAVIQLPIFVGLWQALNNSVRLRHASFLWIQDLAAPDMLFKFPVEVPFLGNYFNLLPFLVVALMLIQTKLFAPPPTTDEARMQQSVMKYMMVFMAFMFYKVPSGLGLYFITSSTWQITERLLLPRVTPKFVAPAAGNDGAVGGNGAVVKPKEKGRIAQLIERVLREASNDPTYRKLIDERDKLKPKDDDQGKSPRPRSGRRR